MGKGSERKGEKEMRKEKEGGRERERERKRVHFGVVQVAISMRRLEGL